MKERRHELNIAIACGGTGGHVFPGFRTAQELKRRGHDVTLWLGGRDVEDASIKGWDGPVIGVRSEGFQSRSLFGGVRVLARLAGSVLRSRRAMSHNVPDVLLAMGSYASVGPALAARSLGVPLVLHEANAVPGKAVGLLARFAVAVGVGFQAAAPRIRNANVVVTGFPVRADLVEVGARNRPAGEAAFVVLVMGGSQGAHRLNEIATVALCRVHREGGGIRVIHLSGMKDEVFVREQYAQAGVPAEVHGFLSEMGRAYGAADLAVARSGAGACAELATCRVPALLVPLPTAARDHQSANARAMNEAGGMDVRAERDLTPEWLAGYIEQARKEPARLASMRAALAGHGSAAAAESLADLVESKARQRVT